MDCTYFAEKYFYNKTTIWHITDLVEICKISSLLARRIAKISREV